MAARKIYKVEVWRRVNPKGYFRYYHHLACVTPHYNILSTGMHKSRAGRWRAVQQLKKLYPALIVIQVKKPTKSK